ncbi:MAG: hypothetical protein IJ165_01070, partial [Proteobacteria bacterium]|nr:hypothetical protein [Pseudomonadota bacterium]
IKMNQILAKLNKANDQKKQTDDQKKQTDDQIKQTDEQAKQTNDQSLYKKILSTNDNIFEDVLGNNKFEFTEYSTSRNPEEDLWFYIEDFSNQTYAKPQTIILNHNSSELPTLKRDEFDKIDFLAIDNDKCIFYQRITKSKQITKKSIFFFSTEFQYQTECPILTFNQYPDAIFEKSKNRLYFQKISAISNIFVGINELYKEAKDEEVNKFLKNDFIQCADGFESKSVNIPNRKKITQVTEKLQELTPTQINKLLDYTKKYCPNICIKNRLYKIGNDKELKQLLDGICENYYTKPITNEKTLAHSTSKL